MGLARASLEWLAIRAGDSKTGNCDRLAPTRIPALLEMEMPPSTGLTFRFARSHRADSQDEFVESSLGRSEDSWRTSKARIRPITSGGR
jgi:hypothetical protein